MPFLHLQRAATEFCVLAVLSSSTLSQLPQPQTSTLKEQSAALPSAARDIRDQDYVISPDDVLDVYVLDVKELSREYRVSASGQVSVPLLKDPIRAAGLTLDQFATAFTSKLQEGGLVTEPNVSVSVKQSRFHSVAITGAVRKPQIYAVMGRTTLLQVLSQAEGITDEAGDVVRITRGPLANVTTAGTTQLPNGGGTDTAAKSNSFTVDLRRLLQTGDPSLDVDVYPGDSVTVPLAGVVYVVGAVTRPGGFTLSLNRQGLTVLQAIALAEDLKPTAKPDKAKIIRRGPQYPNGYVELPVPAKRILAGKTADVALQANDILFIPDSTGKKAVGKTAEAAIQMAIGAVVWRL